MTVAYAARLPKLPYFTSEINPWDMAITNEDYRSGNGRDLAG